MTLDGSRLVLSRCLDPAGINGRVRLQPDLFGVVYRPRDDDAARTRDDVPHVRAALRGTRHVRHLASVAACEPLLEICELREIVSRSDAAQIKAKLGCLGFDPFGAQHQERDTSCLTTYCRIPPWRNARSSSGVSTRAVTVNSRTVPSDAFAATRTSPRGLSAAPPPISEYSS